MAQKNKVLLFKGQSQYDVLRYFVDELDTAFQTLGLQTVVIDLLSPNFISELQRVFQEGNLLFVLGFNAIGQELQIQGRSIYDMLKLPYVAFFVDHPIYHDARLRYSFEYQLVSFVDQDHLDFLKSYYPNRKHMFFIPHGGSVDPTIRSNSIPIQKRSIPILFTGSYKDPDIFLQSINAPEEAIKQIRSIADIMLADSSATVDRATTVYCQSLGVEPSPTYIPLMQAADMYFRMEKRKRIIMSLSELPLTVLGNGWSQMKIESKTLKIMPAKSFSEILQLMGDSQIFLSIAPMHRRGTHERTFCAMLSGAVCVSDKSEYMEQHFLNGQEYIGYRAHDPLPDMLASLLDDPAKMEQIANQGRKQAEQNHTWTNRAVEILRSVKQFLDYKQS